MIVFVFAVGTALVVSFLCSIFESVLLSIGHAHVEGLARSGSKAGLLLRDYKRNMDAPIAAILIANTVAHTIGASVAGASYGEVFAQDTLWIFTIVFTLAVLLFTEIVPKTLGVSHAGSLAAPVAYGIRIFSLALRPLVFVSEHLSKLLRGGRENPVTSLEEIRLLAVLGRDEGVVGARIATMIQGAAELRDLRAKDVMVPRRFVHALAADDTRQDVLDRIGRERYSRYPFTPNGRLDDATGVVLVKELFAWAHTHPDEPIDWEALTTEALVVPETKALTELLRSFQDSRRHMAFVLDEHGGVAGLVTLEDVLEEVVGEIVDESDHEDDAITPLRGGELLVAGNLETRKLREHLGLERSEEHEAQSVGGLAFEALGRPPRRGDVIDWCDRRLEVVRAGRFFARELRLSAPPVVPVTGDAASPPTQE